jgi:universal stress protein A
MTMRKVLVAIELAPESARYVLERATAACADDDRLEVVHVVDPASVTYSIDPTMTGQIYQQMYDQTMANAKSHLLEICSSVGISQEQTHLRYGRVAHEVHELLKEGQFDCCMVGSHGYKGWQRILGSKASSILHGAPVDTWVFSLAGLQSP